MRASLLIATLCVLSLHAKEDDAPDLTLPPHKLSANPEMDAILPANDGLPGEELNLMDPLFTVRANSSEMVLYRYESALAQAIDFAQKFDGAEWDRLIAENKGKFAKQNHDVRGRVQRMDPLISSLLFKWRKNLSASGGALKGDTLKKFDELLKNSIGRKMELERAGKTEPSHLAALFTKEQDKYVPENPLYVADVTQPLPPTFSPALNVFAEKLQKDASGPVLEHAAIGMPDLFSERVLADANLDHLENVSLAGKSVDVITLRKLYQKLNVKLGLGSLSSARAELYLP